VTTQRVSGDGAAARPARGRPRSPDADRAILDAAAAILGERGFAGLTASAVIARSGVARATVYRRYPTRDALLMAASSAVKGRPPYPLSGEVLEDLRRGGRRAREVFAEPAFRRVMPTFIAELAANPANARAVLESLSPNHRRLAEEYAAVAGASGLRTDIDPEVVPTILIGAVMFRLLSSGKPATQGFVDDIVDVLERGLRAEAPARRPRKAS
jgi:AcrR family transcriptional regulator